MKKSKRTNYHFNFLYTFLIVLFLASLTYAGTTLSNSRAGYLVSDNLTINNTGIYKTNGGDLIVPDLNGTNKYSLKDFTSIGLNNVTMNNTGIFYGGDKSFTKTADVVVCRGTDALDDLKKSFECDVVCKSTDNDCSDEINLAYNESDVRKIYLNGLIFPIKNTLYPRHNTLMSGTFGVHHLNNYVSDNNLTVIRWDGSNNGIMVDMELAYLTNGTINISTMGLNDILFDGNYKAGQGLVYRRRGRHHDLQRLTFERINGTAIEFNGFVDDTNLYDVHIENGGANSVGIANPTTMVKMFGGTIAVQNKSAIYFGNTNFGPSMIFYGTLFSGNNAEFVINTTQVMFGITCNACWIEATGSGGIVNFISPTPTILDLSFTNCNIDTYNSLVAFNMTNAPSGTKLNIIGGRTYKGPGTLINANTNVSIMFLNHLYSEFYNISGNASVVGFQNGDLRLNTNQLYSDIYQNLNTIAQSNLYYFANNSQGNVYFYTNSFNILNRSNDSLLSIISRLGDTTIEISKDSIFNIGTTGQNNTYFYSKIFRLYGQMYSNSLKVNYTTFTNDASADNWNINGTLYMRVGGGVGDKNMFLYTPKVTFLNISSSTGHTKLCMDATACNYYLQFNGTCIRAFGTNQIGGCL